MLSRCGTDNGWRTAGGNVSEECWRDGDTPSGLEDPAFVQGKMCTKDKLAVESERVSTNGDGWNLDSRHIENMDTFPKSLTNANGLSLAVSELRLLKLNPNDPASLRKLILHFDVRNTILVADSVYSVNVEQALNSYLSGVTWGKETENGGWEWLCDAPCLTAPVPSATTYYRHVERKTVQSPHDRAGLRKLTGHFTQEEVGERFLPHFRRLLKLMEWPHQVICPDELLTMYGKDRSLYHYLIPAFLKLIEVLVKSRRRFAIIIRTYGMDAPQVLEAVEKTTLGHHPSFPNMMPVAVHRIPGKITREDGDKIEFARTIKNGPSKSEVYSTEGAIYKMLSETEGICGFVDHFEYWANNNFNHSAAKPFWIETTNPDPDVHHIFFDDNIRTMENDSIVNARTFIDASRKNSRSLTLEETAQYASAFLVQANLLESIENDNYFLEKIDECEKSYESILQDSRQLIPASSQEKL